MGIPYEPPPKDLTPGDFHVMPGAVEVDTDSLLEFSQSLLKDVMAFEANAAGPLILMTLDTERGYGEGAIGKDPAFSEARMLSLRAQCSSGESRDLATDLVFGNKALSEVAMVMSERYGGTDNFNAVKTADAVDDFFNPPAGAKNTLGAERARQDEQAEAARRERERLARLPVVDPYDVKFYHMSGLVEGKDFLIAGQGDPMLRANPQDPKTVTKPQDDGDDAPPNEYYSMPVEDEQVPDNYVPPAPEDENDGNALRFDEHGRPLPTLNQQREAQNG